MPRPKKDSIILSCKIHKPIMERLDKHCERTGQSKTTAVERAIDMYIEYCKDDKR